jgi:hypothetical protein
MNGDDGRGVNIDEEAKTSAGYGSNRQTSVVEPALDNRVHHRSHYYDLCGDQGVSVAGDIAAVG